MVLCKHVTKHFPYGIVFSTYILRHLSFFHPFISCLSEILKCQNTPLHTTKWQRKRRILFGMYNGTWMNLSKTRQKYLRKKVQLKLTSRVLFCSPSAVFFNRPSTVVFIDSETYETVPLQCPRCFQFSTRKTPLYGLSLICRATRKARVLQVARTVKGGNSDWKYHFSQTWRIIVRVWSI